LVKTTKQGNGVRTYSIYERAMPSSLLIKQTLRIGRTEMESDRQPDRAMHAGKLY